MAKFSSAALSALLVAMLAAGAMAQYPPPYPPPAYPPPYPPPPVYPPPPSPATNSSLTGYARFLGPLSADCTYSVVGMTNSSGTVLAGTVSASALSSVMTTGTTCKDLFTGVAIPYPVAGDSPSNASFQVSATATISYQSPGIQPASFAYSQIGALGTARLDSTDIFAVLRSSGNISVWTVLSVDTSFIAFNQLLILAYQATNFTGTGNICTTPGQIQANIAQYFTNTTGAFYNNQLPTLVMSSVLARCNASSIAVSTVVTPAVTSAWFFYYNSSPLIRYAPPAITMAIFARYTSFFQAATSLSTLTGVTNMTALASALSSASIVPDQIGTYLGLAGNTPATAASVAVTAVGPLTGTAISFWPYSSSAMSNSTLAATVTASTLTSASTTNPAAYFGFYVVPEGAVDVLLSPDPTNTSTQVKTLAPFGGVVAFPNGTSSGTLTVAPISSIVNATWWAQQAPASAGNYQADLPVPAAVTADNYRAAYYTVLGASAVSTIFAKEFTYNLQTRDYPAGGYTAAAVAVADTLVPSLPGLGASFLYKAVNTSSKYPLRDVAQWFYNATSAASGASYTNNTFITTLLYSVYVTLGGAPVYSPPPPSPYGSYPPPPPVYGAYPPPPANGRRLLQTAPITINDILAQVATCISSSNSLITDQITTVVNAAQSGAPVNMTALLTRLAQVAAVQQTDLAAALSAIAAKVSSGDLSGALTLATQAASDFSGQNLINKVNAKQINTAAVNALATGGVYPPPPASSDDGGDNKKKLALGLGLGLGLGIPLAIGAVAGVAYCIKARRAQQETAPAAAAAEGIYYGDAPAASVATEASTQDSTARLAQYYRTRVGSNSTAV